MKNQTCKLLTIILLAQGVSVCSAGVIVVDNSVDASASFGPEIGDIFDVFGTARASVSGEGRTTIRTRVAPS